MIAAMLPPRVIAALSLLALPALPACTVPKTEVRVRDPGDVTLEADTPNGPTEILPRGRKPIEAVLPRTEPPYLGTALFEAHPIRTSLGGIVLRCDACVGFPLQKVLGDDGF